LTRYPLPPAARRGRTKPTDHERTDWQDGRRPGILGKIGFPGGPGPTPEALTRSRSTPLAVSRRNYYPGFFGALFLVLLRIAIGWHFHNEGWEKIESRWKGDRAFSAEGFLRGSTGPLSPYFRGLVPDVNGLARLDPARLKAGWEADVEHMADHFGLNDQQRAEAKKEVARSEEFADAWFQDREASEKRRQYVHDLAEVQKVERNYWTSLSYERERAAAKRKDLDTVRADLLKDIDARGQMLREAVTKIATREQLASAGAYVPPPTRFDRMNLFITYSVWLIGLCLMLGLFTRLAALGGALFLLQIYLSMPPWPGLPVSPRAEGHYFIVDKNLVEMLACMALAFLPTGYWVGLDAVLSGRRRRALAREIAEQELAEQSGGRGRRAHTVS
jgi:uncharacterized membrane protein YphA (DoxX/SURF4 family)